MPKRKTPPTGKVDLYHDLLVDPTIPELIFGDEFPELDNAGFSLLSLPDSEYSHFEKSEKLSGEEEFDQVQFTDVFMTGIDGVCTCLPAQYYRCQIHDPEDEKYGDPSSRSQALQETYGSSLVRERFGHQSSRQKLA